MKTPSKKSSKPAFNGGKKPFPNKGKTDGSRGSFHKQSKPPQQKKPALPKVNPEHCLFGFHPVIAAMGNKERTIVKIWTTENAWKTIEPHYNPKRHPEPFVLERKEIDSLVGEGVHQGIVIETKPLDEVFLKDILIQTQDDDKSTLVILDHVTDPHNVGAVLRSASAFGAKAVIVHKRYAPPITGTLAKSSVGATEYVPLVKVQNLAQAMDEIKTFNYTIIGFDEGGTETLGKYDMPERSVVVMGAEGDGMRELTGKKCDVILKLPTQGPIGSLNVSNAAAIALYETTK